ncbi:hypothetical protein LWU40_18120 [Enterobacter hormaechei]|nr:hypothetical protein [Enterobacter hormaechei]
MPQQGSVGRRLEAAFSEFSNKNYESCLIHLFPAIDKTSKKRYPKAKVGERICKFIQEEQDLISYIATGNILSHIEIDGMTLSRAIYLYGRCPIAHEGELDPRLQISEDNTMMFGTKWVFSTNFIFALMISVIVAPENSEEFFVNDIGLSFCNKNFMGNDLWGNAVKVRESIELTKLNNYFSSIR